MKVHPERLSTYKGKQSSFQYNVYRRRVNHFHSFNLMVGKNDTFRGWYILQGMFYISKYQQISIFVYEITFLSW